MMENMQQYIITGVKIALLDAGLGASILICIIVFLWLAKKVFGKIPWGVLLLTVRAFYQITPVLWKKIFPILKTLWKESLNKLIIKNGSHYTADKQKNPKKEEED